MRLGPHTGKLSDPFLQRMIASANEWGVFQTHYAGPKSLAPASLVPGEHSRRPLWVWHAAYIAAVNTTDDRIGGYLERLIADAAVYKIHSTVVHVGRSTRLPATEVTDGVHRFLDRHLLLDRLRDADTQLAIEMPANICDLSVNPDVLLRHFHGSPVGWCLDMAHANGAGMLWSHLRETIAEFPPIVCHANFPGSEWGSGVDAHGWRSAPEQLRIGRSVGARDVATTERLVREYDETLRLLARLDVPLILEGSGFPGSDWGTEMTMIKEILR